MPSPRRSTRSALPPPRTQHSNSSASSLSSSKPERNTRTQTKPSPPQQTDSPLSADQGDDPVEGDTRCVCGHAEYPGLPLTDDVKARTDVTEETGAWFIACDVCQVWQHAGCVGFENEDLAPDKYSCELCDKRSHHLMTDAKGHRYSRYQPVSRSDQKTARKTSISRESETKSKKERETQSRASVESTGVKKRSTANSRYAYYDHDEELERVLAESIAETETGVPTRKGKRSRDESEDTKQESKRQRTNSDSLEGGSTLKSASLDADSDEDAPSSRFALKKAKSIAAETQRQRDLRKREIVKETQRAEAAGRRKERAGRRRIGGDESEAIEDTPRPEMTKTASVAEASQPPSPPTIELPPPSSSHKKGGKKGKRLGRNQYTKDREVPANSPNLAKAGGSHDSGEERTSKTGNGEVHKNSPGSANDSVGNPITTKAKGNRWKGKGPKGAASNDSDSGREKGASAFSLKDMERAIEHMSDWTNRNYGEGRVVEGTSMLNGGSASSGAPQSQGQTAAPTSAPSASAAPTLTEEIEALGTSAEAAEVFRRELEKMKALLYGGKQKSGGLTVSG